jgi:hypothetical protein
MILGGRRERERERERARSLGGVSWETTYPGHGDCGCLENSISGVAQFQLVE